MKTIIYGIIGSILLSSALYAAPVGNTGTLLLTGDGIFLKERPFQISASLDFDYQQNSLPGQIKRFTWSDPSQTATEVRHYEQIRSSTNTLFCSGIKVGTNINRISRAYIMMGILNADVDFSYYDKTINFTYTTKSDFESDNEFYYGAGFSVIMHEDTWRDKYPVNVGMDLKYRKLTMKDDHLGSNGKFYSFSLNELQMAFVVSAETGRFYPYCGFRISSMTGQERFVNKNAPGTGYPPANYYSNGYISYKRKIKWFKNIGYVTGLSFHVKEMVRMNLEVRGGDEDGIGLTSTIKF